MKNEMSKRLDICGFILWGFGIFGSIFLGVVNQNWLLVVVIAMGSFIGSMVMFGLAEIINILERSDNRLAHVEDRMSEISRYKYKNIDR